MSAPTKTPETLTAAARAAQLSLAAQGQSASSGGKISVADARARLALAVERPANAAVDLKVGDDLDGSTMVLPVDAIRTYDKNPRTGDNPKYLPIKESVRVQGVTNQITVTKRPGESFYVPYGGGNTRVLVSQELWQETQDPKFKHLTVLYRSWRGDAANIAAHLAENNNRGDTSYWDTACGICALKRELEQDTGRVLSAPELNKESRRLGMDFGNSSVQAFVFAVEFLSPIGPWLTARGVHQTLKPAFNALQALCAQLGVGPVDFRKAVDRSLELTGEMLRSQEANKAADVELRLDVDDLVRSLNESIAGVLNVPAAQVPLLLAARAANPRGTADELRRAVTVAPRMETPTAAPAHRSELSSDEVSAAGPSPATSQAAQSRPSAQQLPLQPAMLAPVQLPVATATPVPAAERSADSPGPLRDPSDPSHAPGTVREILADITRTADLHDVVAVCDDMPLGYYVEVPDAGIEIIDGRPSSDPALRRAAWCVLAAFSGQFDQRLCAKLPDESRWRELAEGDRETFNSQLQALGIAHDDARRFIAPEDLHAFFWHPDLGELFLQLWSWALHWRNADPARFVDRLQRP